MTASEMRKLMEGIITEESYSIQDVLEALQDLLDSTSLQAYATHQHTAKVKAKKILDSFGIKSSMRENDEEEFDWKSEMETGVVIQDNTRGGYDVGSEGKHLGHFDDMDEALAAIEQWMKKNQYFPNIFFVNDHGNVSHIDKDGNEIQSIVENQHSGMDAFTMAYMEAALWSSSDNSNEQGGDSLDKNYDFSDIADETKQQMASDCASFQEKAWDDISENEKGAGHDFWLTRNGHGAGFWDGDWPEPQATQLTELSKKFGEFDLYVGDDGKIYGS